MNRLSAKSAGEATQVWMFGRSNAGKTALAQSLSGDIHRGAVSPTPFETESSMEFGVLPGQALKLWDTPSLVPLGRLWLLGWRRWLAAAVMVVWSWWRDPQAWRCWRALRAARSKAHGVIYVVDATDNPADSAYLADDLLILEWLAKPTVVVVNQLGRRSDAGKRQQRLQTWRHVLAERGLGRIVCVDACYRSWIDMAMLHEELIGTLGGDACPGYNSGRNAWLAEQREVLRRSVHAAVRVLLQCVVEYACKGADISREKATVDASLAFAGVRLQAAAELCDALGVPRIRELPNMALPEMEPVRGTWLKWNVLAVKWPAGFYREILEDFLKTWVCLHFHAPVRGALAGRVLAPFWAQVIQLALDKQRDVLEAALQAASKLNEQEAVSTALLESAVQSLLATVIRDLYLDVNVEHYTKV